MIQDLEFSALDILERHHMDQQLSTEDHALRFTDPRNEYHI